MVEFWMVELRMVGVEMVGMLGIETGAGVLMIVVLELVFTLLLKISGEEVLVRRTAGIRERRRVRLTLIRLSIDLGLFI
jgi:hypothetical protein